MNKYFKAATAVILFAYTTTMLPLAYAFNGSVTQEKSEIDDIFAPYEIIRTQTSVVTIHKEGTITTKIEVFFEDGKVITSVYDNEELVSVQEEINESVKKANQKDCAYPILQLPIYSTIFFSHMLLPLSIEFSNSVI